MYRALLLSPWVLLLAVGLEVRATPMVVEFVVYDARTSTAALGNITGTQAVFRAKSDTDLVARDSAGTTSMPMSSIDVTVEGTPLGTLHGSIVRSPITLSIDAAGFVTLRMEWAQGYPYIVQGIFAHVPVLVGYRFDRSLGPSNSTDTATFVSGVPVSSRLAWEPDVAGIGPLGAGPIPARDPGGTFAITILEPIPAVSPAMLAWLALAIVAMAWGMKRGNWCR